MIFKNKLTLCQFQTKLVIVHCKKWYNSKDNYKMIETERLILKPLTYDQLLKYAKCDNSLEKELNLNLTSRIISPELKEALEQTIIPNVADKTKNHLYSTLWTAISKKENKMIGDLCIIGEPNSKGER